MQQVCVRCKNKRSDFKQKLDGSYNKTCIRCIEQTQKYHRDNPKSTRRWNEKSRKKNGYKWGKQPEQLKRKKEYSKQYWEENKEALKPVNAKRSRLWYKTIGRKKMVTVEGRYKMYVAASKRVGRKFDLSFEEFSKFANQPCHYCSEIVNPVGLDRVDNDIDYERDNIVSCCQICNFMKRSMHKNMFIEKCLQIAKTNGLSDTN